MPLFYSYLRLRFKSGLSFKSRLNLKSQPHQSSATIEHAAAPKDDLLVDKAEIQSPCESIGMGISEHHMQQIIRQVHAEGYCIESLSTFDSCHHHSGDLILAVESIAAYHGLKLSINHTHQLCFFEKL